MKSLILVITIVHFTISSYSQGRVITRDLKTMNIASLSKLDRQALLAIEYGQMKKLKKLVEANKIDLEHTIQKKPILIICSQKGKYKLVEYLLSKGANPNSIDQLGRTSLLAASSFKHDKIVNLLKKYGADGAIGHSAEDFVCVGYEKLKKNMSYSDVQRIIGDKFSLSGISDKVTNIIYFTKNDSFVFKNGKLSSWPCM